MGRNQAGKRHGVLRVMTALVLAGILAYGGIVAMICMKEGKVAMTEETFRYLSFPRR